MHWHLHLPQQHREKNAIEYILVNGRMMEEFKDMYIDENKKTAKHQCPLPRKDIGQ